MRSLLLFILILTLPALSLAQSTPVQAAVEPNAGAATASAASTAAEFDRLRFSGNDAVYNMDYKFAANTFQQMVKLIPDHPAGYIYLANNMWLEWLNANRRLSTSLYSGGSFYNQDAEEDKFDPKRDKEFQDLIKKAIEVAKARLAANPKDVEALYYQGAAQGLRAAYTVTVKRSFRKAIGDANGSVKIQKQVVKLDPNYTDAYLSIGVYEYTVDNLSFFWRTLARVVGIRGSKKKGIEYLESVTQKGKFTADDARVVLIGVYSREKQPEKSLELISYLSKKYPRNYLFGIERATMLYQRNRGAEGAQVFSELLKDERTASLVTDLINYQWAESLMKTGETAAAVDHYKEVIKWAKSEKSLVSQAHLRLGQALDTLGKRDEAVAQYQTVLKRENIFDSHKQAKAYIEKPFVDEAAKRKS
ncbi:MAG: tetratricopeptide repeat protein [Acidobacteriota bacterium]